MSDRPHSDIAEAPDEAPKTVSQPKCPNCGSAKVFPDFDRKETVCHACGYVLDPQQVLEIEGIPFTAQELAERSLLKIRNWQTNAQTMHQRIDDTLQTAIERETEASTVKPGKTCKRCGKPLISAHVGPGRRTEYHPWCKKKTSREQSNERQKRWRKKHPNLKRGKGFARRLIAKDAVLIAEDPRRLGCE